MSEHDAIKKVIEILVGDEGYRYMTDAQYHASIHSAAHRLIEVGSAISCYLCQGDGSYIDALTGFLSTCIRCNGSGHILVIPMEDRQ